MDILSAFSENLSELIGEKNLTVRQFAEQVGLDLSEVYRYLRKEYLPQLSTIIKIADLYGCSVDYLLGFTAYDEKKSFRKTPPFSQRLKEILSEKELSRYRLSKDTEISIHRIDDWYHGRFLPSLDKVIVLAEYFGRSVDYILGREI